MRKLSIIVKMLKSENKDTRQKGKKRLRALNHQTISEEDITYLIKEAGNVYQDEYKSEDCCFAIAAFLTNYPSSESLELIEEYFDKFSSWGKAQFLHRMTLTPNVENLEMLKKLMEKYAGQIEDFIIKIPPNDTLAVSVLFPKMIDLSNDLKLTYTINNYMLDCLQYGTLLPEDIDMYLLNYLKKYKSIKNTFDSLDVLDEMTIEEKEHYRQITDILITTLDVLGHISYFKEVQDIILDNTNVNNKEIKLISVYIALYQNMDFEMKHIIQLSKDDLTRSRMYGMLESLAMNHLFPIEEKTQEKLARSEFIHYLTSPNELGEEPTEIELAGVVKRYDENMGEVSYYMYRFKSKEELYGNDWMIGMTGYYLEKYLSSSPYKYSATNYDYENELTLDEHLDIIMEIAEQTNWGI